MKTDLITPWLLLLAAPKKRHRISLSSPKSGLLLESIWHQGKTKFQLKSATLRTQHLTTNR